jgi:copper chaperone NosL
MKKLFVAIAVVATALAIVVYGGTRLPDGVQPIAWNAEACGHCQMLIGDPAFAAQAILDDGTVVSFDDPGCAAAYIRKHRARLHRAWFHDGRTDAWIALEDVGFERVAHSPMGSNVIAVPKTTPGALTLEDIR